MPSISIENGKRIEELLEVTRISDQSFFLVSETDLTRKITLTYLRNAFSGDTATENLNNLYYSVEKINELLDHVWDDIGKINTKLDSLEDRINNIYNDLGADLSDFKNYVEQIYAELKLADKNLNTKIDNVNTTLNNKIDNVNTTLNNKIDDLDQELSDRITNVQNTLNQKIDQLEENLTQEINRVETELDARLEVVENKLANITGIDIGTAVPSTLANGRIYLQYF